MFQQILQGPSSLGKDFLGDDPTNIKTPNMFQEILKDPRAAEKKYLGEDYPYYKNINSPSELGMSSKGSLEQFGKDLDGLISYVELLVTGDSKASKTGRPLGNKFFVQTPGKCIDKKTGAEVDRYMYIDNVPAGNIPLISSGLGTNFTEFRGIIPGTLSNLNSFNPITIFQSFLEKTKPDCQELTMEVIDIYNNRSTESHFVAESDIKALDPCIFPDRRNPLLPDSACKETFKNMLNEPYTCYKIPDDPLVQIYFGALGALGVYILYKIMVKNGMLPNK